MKHIFNRIFSSLFLAIMAATAIAQENNKTTIASDVVILVNDIGKTGAKVDSFINKYKLIPVNYRKNQNEINLSLLLELDVFNDLNNIIKNWGYISSTKTNSVDYSEEIRKTDRQIKLLTDEINQYKILISKVDSSDGERYFSYSEKIINLNKEIASLIIEKKDLEELQIKYKYVILIIEEKNSTEKYESSWINMPGIEYSYLITEQPVKGESPEIMQGICLKYMFSTGKSYGILGLYKSAGNDTISEIDENYIFAFGQDFYSKYLGRGQRKFLNLYTSFNVGVYISSSETMKSASWFVNPFLGVELFKTKYLLLDTKVGYYMPYRNNRNQRGLLCNVSFNFAF